jgi:DNA-binding NtrC family response regulator
MDTERKIKLLLVDDEAKFLKSIAGRLELQDFDVTTATNGNEAITRAEEGLFDVAVVDLKMPGMDGEQVLKVLKKRHNYIEIIILTGHATLDAAVKCSKLGAFQFLEKPYAFEKLTETIKDAYKERMIKKFEHDAKRYDEIQKLSIGSSPLGILKALLRLDNEEK